MKKLYSLLGNVDELVTCVLGNLETVGIDASGYQIDHFGYRAESLEEYKNLKISVQKIGIRIITELSVRNRPIGVFGLAKPIRVQGFEIPYFEILHRL